MTKKKNNNFYGFILTVIDYINPFAGLHELFTVLRYYYIVRKTLYSPEGIKVIKDYNNKGGVCPLRIDNLGRIYTVINISEEIVDDEDMLMMLTLEEMRQIDKILLPLGITEMVTPDIDKRYDEEKQTNFILIVIAPNTSFFTLGNIIWELIKIVVLILGIIYII